MNVSILIPTYNRPEQFTICLKSCLNQTVTPSEIIIGDDSTNLRTEAIVREIAPETDITIHYVHNKKSLGQGANVHQLIQKASGDLLCLIHDDDYLSPQNIELLTPFFRDSEVLVAYGKQIIVADDGTVDMAASEKLNRVYDRTEKENGVQDDLITSAIRQQIPNNGFLVRTEYAKEIGYQVPYEIFGDACDFGFALLLAENNPTLKAVFLDEYTSYYRVSTVSVSRNNPSFDGGYRSFRYIYALPKTIRNQQIVRQWLIMKSPIAVGTAINQKHIREATKWMFSRYHLPHIVSLGGIRRLMRLLVSMLGSLLGR